MKRALQVGLLVAIVVVLVSAALSAAFARPSPGIFPFVPSVVGGLFAYWFLSCAPNVEVHCPNCRRLQPAWRKPASIRQAFLGGFSCAGCGTEMDRNGRPLFSRP